MSLVEPASFRELYPNQAPERTRNNCRSNEKEYIKAFLSQDKYNPVALEELKKANPFEFKKVITMVYLCSKFHIRTPYIETAVNRKINQLILYLVCNPNLASLYDMVYVKTFRSYEFMLQQHVQFIKPLVETDQVLIGDYKNKQITVHYLDGSIIGFSIEDGPKWKIGERVSL